MDNIERVRAWQEEHKKLWLCVECNNKAISGLRCKECNKRRNEYKKKYRKNWKELWLCYECWKAVLVNKNVCLKHYLKKISLIRLWTQSYDKQLKELMEKQNHKCALTWDDINWGDDIELDHIIPTSKWWSNTLDNIQWTTKKANRLKQDMTIKELKILCSKVLNNSAVEM